MATALMETKKPLPKRNSFSIESLIGRQTTEPDRSEESPSPRDHRTRDSPSPEVENRCSAFTGNDMSLKHLANSFNGQMDVRLFQPLKMCNRLAGLPMSPLMTQQMSAYPPFNPLMYSLDRPGHSPNHSWIHPGYPGFQHPRFPIGPHPSLFFHPYRKPKRNRTAFSPSQLLQLEQAFEKNHYVVGQERKQLASKLQLSETQVKVWFQNRRTKHKRTTTEDEASVTSQQDDADLSSAMHEKNIDSEHARTLDARDSASYDSEKDSSFSDEELPVDVGT